jgi:hypothetical protein
MMGAKSEEDMRDTSVSPSYGTSTGSSVLHTPLPLPLNTGHIYSNVQMHTPGSNILNTLPGSSTNPTAPHIPPKTKHIYADKPMHPVRNNLRSDATKPEEDDACAVCRDVSPPRFPETTQFG